MHAYPTVPAIATLPQIHNSQYEYYEYEVIDKTNTIAVIKSDTVWERFIDSFLAILVIRLFISLVFCTGVITISFVTAFFILKNVIQL